MKQRRKGAWRPLGALATCLALLTTLASGYERIDTQRRGSVRLTYVDSSAQDAAPLEGMELKLYQVASMSSSAEFTPTEDFEASAVKLNGEVAWVETAQTLEGYVQSRQEEIDPVPATEKTDAQGVFEARELAVGLYLIVGSPLKKGRDTYTPTAFLMSLPQLDEETDDWNYDIEETVWQKVTHSHEETQKRDLRVTAEKIWVGDDAESRPAEVKVTLLRNGKEYEQVTLNAAKGWKHTWTGLSRSAEWSLAEEVPEGYTVLVEREQSGNKLRFVVTNTAPELEPPPASPTPSPEPSQPNVPPPAPSAPAEQPITPSGGLSETQPQITPTPVREEAIPEREEQDEKLPQTGANRYFTWFLGGSGGMLMLAGGVILTRRKRYA